MCVCVCVCVRVCVCACVHVLCVSVYMYTSRVLTSLYDLVLALCLCYLELISVGTQCHPGKGFYWNPYFVTKSSHSNTV